MLVFSPLSEGRELYLQDAVVSLSPVTLDQQPAAATSHYLPSVARSFALIPSSKDNIRRHLLTAACPVNTVCMDLQKQNVAEPTKPRNCIWQNVEITAKKRLLIQVLSLFRYCATKLLLLLLN